MRELDPGFRNELKFVISAAQIPLFKSRLLPLLQHDSNAGEDGSYKIRSLYFDDYRNTSFYENENGVAPREKFRIRIYNGSDTRIVLECKQKQQGKTHKEQCPLTREQADRLIAGKAFSVSAGQPPLLRKLLLQMQLRRLRPAMIVEYERVPYVCRNGNVRVTFDTNISSSPDVEHFFAQNVQKRPVMPAGQHLLEVKYDAYLPDAVYEALNLSGLRQETFSKYYLCRKFTVRK